ncbi:MAG: hypothetical protein ACRYFS_02050 [Janthinobacterium lividum]
MCDIIPAFAFPGAGAKGPKIAHGDTAAQGVDGREDPAVRKLRLFRYMNRLGAFPKAFTQIGYIYIEVSDWASISPVITWDMPKLFLISRIVTQYPSIFSRRNLTRVVPGQ